MLVTYFFAGYSFKFKQEISRKAEATLNGNASICRVAIHNSEKKKMLCLFGVVVLVPFPLSFSFLRRFPGMAKEERKLVSFYSHCSSVRALIAAIIVIASLASTIGGAVIVIDVVVVAVPHRVILRGTIHRVTLF